MNQRHSPPTAPLVFLSEPIDLSKGPTRHGYDLAREIADTGCTVYRPATTWHGGQHNPGTVEWINRDVLRRADVLVADLRQDCRTIGVPMEIEAATARGINVVAVVHPGAPRSVALQANPWVVFADHNSEAVALASDYAHIHSRATNNPPATPELKFVMDDGDDAPNQAYPDDAGYDLVTSHPTEVPAHGWADIPTTVVGVQPPPDTWLMITGRSSTPRKYGLIIPPAVLDTGWRGCMLAGALNFTDRPVKIQPGTRLAQVIPMPNHAAGMRAVSVGHGALAPSARGVNGFGSSGA